jgi:hypothetical protein
MIEYAPPCTVTHCKVSDPWESKLCAGIAKSIIEAGAAGAFEASPCPFEALWFIAADDSERMITVQQRLGIAGTTQID